MEHARIICRVCQKQFSKYTCPRCNCTYCSLPCFKQHSHACTESFYRDQAVVQLKDTRAGDADKRKVQEILHRFHTQMTEDAHELQQEGGIQQQGGRGGEGKEGVAGAAAWGLEEGEEEEEEGEGEGEAMDAILSQETLAKLLAQIQQVVDSSQPTCSAELEQLIDELVLDEGDLTPQELRGLQRAAAAGSLSHLLQPWQPWWLTPEAKDIRLGAAGQPLVSERQYGQAALRGDAQPAPRDELHEEGESRWKQSRAAATASASAAVPAPPGKPLPSLASLSRSPPSPFLRWHLLDVLYAYCFTMRTYNGDVHGGMELEAAGCALDLSAVLSLSAAPARPSPAAPASTPSSAAERSSEGPASKAEPEGLPRLATEAVLGCLTRACQPPVGDPSSRPLAVATLGDVTSLVGAGRSAVILALTDLQEVMEEAAGKVQGLEAAAGGGAAAGRPGVWARGKAAADAATRPLKERRGALKAAARKLHFFSCWTNEQNEATLSSLQSILEAEWQQHQAALPVSDSGAIGSIASRSEQHRQQQQQPETGMLIQELH